MSDSLYLALRQQIVNGEFQVGAQLTEAAMAERFGVSRTPIREALRRLEQDGLLEPAPRGGVRVKVWGSEEVFDLYEVRIVLEARAAEIAAERRTRLDISQLKTANDKMAAADVDDPAQLRSTNLRFHEALWRASHNAPLVETLTRLQRQILRHPAHTLSYPGRWAEVLDEHQELIDAIESGDAGRASSIAESHMTTARDIRLQLYDTDGTG